MRLSRYFLPLLKEDPIDAKITSHRLMLRAGMVRQLTSGIYNWLPMGLSVLRNIETIIQEEMARAGALEILMPTLQPAELWQESGRYDNYGKEMLRVQDRHDHALLYGPTNEEVVTDIFRNQVQSYKDLPLNLYQCQWKFRDEIRPRFGVMRGREFLMKDGYSFDLDEASAQKSYQAMYDSYIRIFARMELAAVAVDADNGAIGGSLSQEFQILTDIGENEIIYDPKLKDYLHDIEKNHEAIKQCYAAAVEVHDAEKCPLDETELCRSRATEIAHIFSFGDKYSKAMNAQITNKEGKNIYPQMGSYGIGISRLVAAIIEASHDESGIIWPESVAPFKVGVINLRVGHEECDKACEDLMAHFSKQHITALYDDTKDSIGKKFSKMDMIGLPWQVAVGPKSIKDGQVEVKSRRSGEKKLVSIDGVRHFFEEKLTESN